MFGGGNGGAGGAPFVEGAGGTGLDVDGGRGGGGGGAESVWNPPALGFGELRGGGGGGIAAGVIESLGGGGGGKPPAFRAGGGGGFDGSLFPSNGGGTPNFVGWEGGETGESSPSGSFGGRGGGGGPGVLWLVALFLAAGVARSSCANLPASAIGGGALNLGLGGEGARGGLGDGLGGRCPTGAGPPAVRLEGGGAGGGPRFAVLVLLPVFCGLRFATF